MMSGRPVIEAPQRWPNIHTAWHRIQTGAKFCRFTVVCCCAIFAAGKAGFAQSPHDQFEEAVREYKIALDEKDRDARLAKFGRAEMLFEQLTSNEGAATQGNAELWVNLGNAALGAERLGPAIVAYRRALFIEPNHLRAKQNLRHARSLLPDWVPRPLETGSLDTFLASIKRRSPDELRWIAASLFLIASASFAASLRWRQALLKVTAGLAILLWATLLAVSVLDALRIPEEAAVVIVSEVIARSADAAGAPARWPQPMPNGTELIILERRDEWIRIRLADGRDAWIPAGSVQTISTE